MILLTGTDGVGGTTDRKETLMEINVKLQLYLSLKKKYMVL